MLDRLIGLGMIILRKVIAWFNEQVRGHYDLSMLPSFESYRGLQERKLCGAKWVRDLSYAEILRVLRENDGVFPEDDSAVIGGHLNDDDTAEIQIDGSVTVRVRKQ